MLAYTLMAFTLLPLNILQLVFLMIVLHCMAQFTIAQWWECLLLTTLSQKTCCTIRIRIRGRSSCLLLLNYSSTLSLGGRDLSSQIVERALTRLLSTILILLDLNLDILTLMSAIKIYHALKATIFFIFILIILICTLD